MALIKWNTFLKIDIEDQKFTEYLGNYDYYIEKKRQFIEIQQEKAAGGNVVETEQVSTATLDWKRQKEIASMQRKKENKQKKPTLEWK